MTHQITVHQIHLGDKVIDDMKRYGREVARESHPVITAKDEVSFFGGRFQPEFWEYYSKQGHIDIEQLPRDRESLMDLLDKIYEAGNDSGYGPLADEYHRYPTAYSISVGDIIIVAECAYIVASCGFEQVELTMPKMRLALKQAIDTRLGRCLTADEYKMISDHIDETGSTDIDAIIAECI